MSKEGIALLDTGSECNFISLNIVIGYLRILDRIQVQDDKTAIPIRTLNGDEVTPYGEIKLRFYGNGGSMNPRIYFETFLVIDGDVPWDVIIGHKFLEKNGIYKRLGLVGIHPRMTEGGFSRFLSWSFGPLASC
jgi:hypothetical protein